MIAFMVGALIGSTLAFIGAGVAFVSKEELNLPSDPWDILDATTHLIDEPYEVYDKHVDDKSLEVDRAEQLKAEAEDAAFNEITNRLKREL